MCAVLYVQYAQANIEKQIEKNTIRHSSPTKKKICECERVLVWCPFLLHFQFFSLLHTNHTRQQSNKKKKTVARFKQPRQHACHFLNFKGKTMRIELIISTAHIYWWYFSLRCIAYIIITRVSFFGCLFFVCVPENEPDCHSCHCTHGYAWSERVIFSTKSIKNHYTDIERLLE